jgi:hypothetical protein
VLNPANHGSTYECIEVPSSPDSVGQSRLEYQGILLRINVGGVRGEVEIYRVITGLWISELEGSRDNTDPEHHLGS